VISHCVGASVAANISKACGVFRFRVKESNKKCQTLISGFRRDVGVICGLLGNYTASCANYLPLFFVFLPSIYCFFLHLFLFSMSFVTPSFGFIPYDFLFSVCYCAFHLVVYSSVLMSIFFSILIPTLIITFLFYFILF
jgi:hypothetical protein